MAQSPQALAETPSRTPTTEEIADQVARMGAGEAARALEELDDDAALKVLQRLNPGMVGDIIPHLGEERRGKLFAAGPSALMHQWSLNQAFPEDSIGRLMEPPTAVFHPRETVAEVIDKVKDLVKKIFVTYCFVTDEDGKLVGIVTMRDLLVSSPSSSLADVMLRDPFFLTPNTTLTDAMNSVVYRHYPVYPVCDDSGVLIGLVRGQAMFQEQTFEISAQPGRMVGVGKEERLLTPWPRSLLFRHPWLQLNLLTAFVAAAVVGIFQSTLDRMVILALFLPVLAGQSGNTGCQALAVTLRGMTLGELESGSEKALVAKEAMLGLFNGALVGLTAGLGMFVVASMQSNPDALSLAAIVALAMTGSCVVSGISGALIPLGLRRIGADPATASSIFLTTATDVASMGLFLGLATLLLG
ncbi:MAG: magnesium transporter [Gemmatimonadales bacterium]